MSDTNDNARIFSVHGPVNELELDEELQQHLLERGFFPKHHVALAEIIEVHIGESQFFKNGSDQRAPIIMIGPTSNHRYLCIPIEPAGRWGVWRVVTAFEANAHHVKRYNGG